jgi:hypothetical protein
MGAGPESTGTDDEQLRLFDEYDTKGETNVVDATHTASEVADVHRSHALGHRPEWLHTRDHPGVRGDRLEGVCLRRIERDN